MHNRDIDTALTYHEETKHSYDSVYHNHHFLDRDNQPRPFKLYVDLEPYSLPSTLPDSHLPALQALAPSRDEQKPQTRLTLDDLAYILFYSAPPSPTTPASRSVNHSARFIVRNLPDFVSSNHVRGVPA